MDRPLKPRIHAKSSNSEELAPPGTSDYVTNKKMSGPSSSPKFTIVSNAGSPNQHQTPKATEKIQRLRAFSIQKKTPITSVTIPKLAGSGNTTVLIGKLSSVKVTPKPTVTDDDPKKPPRPPKPGTNRKSGCPDSYSDLQKKTLSEIEDMKRKMELVELGIPLGLICPTSTSEKAMPTKAMPPIKSFLASSFRVCAPEKRKPTSAVRPQRRRKHGASHYPSKVDELIREAKKAKAEGKEFKFDYQKLLPDYDNPFQRRREDSAAPEKKSSDESEFHNRSGKKDRRKSDRYEGSRKHQDYRKEEDRYQKERSKEKQEMSKDKRDSERNTDNETDVNLSDYLVCDSWSLDEKNNSSSPQVEESVKTASVRMSTPQPSTSTVAEMPTKPEPTDNLRQAMFRKNTPERNDTGSPMLKPNNKIQKLQPVMDSFKYEIDPNDEEILDMFDEHSDLEKYSKVRKSYDSSQGRRSVDYDLDRSKEVSLDGMNDDNFLESVINEIKQEEDMADDETSKGLVEYDFSPIKDEDETELAAGSVTPELDERMQRSFRSDYSDSLRSTDSDYKTSESGYKSVDSCLSTDSFRSVGTYDLNMSKSTVSSLEMWSFVLKICQPLLFRHDRNKCYKETQTTPKLWYFESPKVCNCVKDRSVVYKELEICKSDHVNLIYDSCKATEAPAPAGGAAGRAWYPRAALCLTEAEAEQGAAGGALHPGAQWEAERRATPPADEISLDREYQRFMDAVWPEVVVDVKQEAARSTTPVRQNSRKKKMAEEAEDKKRSKKIKLSSEGWSQESDVEEEPEKNKKMKVVKDKEKKHRKRKHSTSTSTLSSLSESEPDSKRRKKAYGKENKKSKSKMAKRKKMDKKKLKKLKEKQKKRKKMSKEVKMEEGSEDDFDEVRKRDHKKSKKKQQKLKRKNMKRKAKSSSSSESSSSSSSDSDSTDSDSDDRRTKKAKRKEEKARKKMEKKSRTQKKKRKSSSEELFDVNILNNIKKERVEDDNNRKKLIEQEFSPRRQQLKRIEIINVKELQDDFVGNNNIHIKLETVEDTEKEQQRSAVEAKVVREVKDVSEVKDVCEAKDMSDMKDVSEEMNIREVKDMSEEKDIREVKNVSEVKEVSEEKDIKEVNNVREVKNIIEEKDVKDLKNVSETRDEDRGREVKDVREAKDMIEVRDESEVKDVSEVKAVKEVKVVEEVPVCDVMDQNNVYTLNLSDICMPQEKEPNNKIEDIKESPRPALQLDQAIESQSCQESVYCLKDHRTYEKDDSHLRPPSQNYNYSDTIVASQSDNYEKDAASNIECDDKFAESYEPENYELYERLAMAYQNDVAAQSVRGGGRAGGEDVLSGGGSRRIETVVRARPRGEIKCDWRAGEPSKGPPPDATSDNRPSRWGLKPSDVNIVLTGGGTEAEPPQYPAGAPPEPEVFQIQSIANRNDSAPNATDYDEAYMDMYGAADRLQYGDCFADEAGAALPPSPGGPGGTGRGAPAGSDPRWASLDVRIDHALRHSVLGEVAMEPESMDADKDGPEKRISQAKAGRVTKRVSFADGYKPGQDSDAEDPPVVKPRRRARRVGCAWPCPASHPDHVPLWDALPPPPPPPGSPPPAPLRRVPAPPAAGAPPVPLALKTDPSAPLPTILPPELPSGLITFT